MRAILLIVLVLVAGVGALAWRTSKGVDPAGLEALYVTGADQFVALDERLVRVRVEGPTGAPAVLLVHGFGMSLESWDGWAGGLIDAYRVVRVDLPGHGLTGPDPKERYTNADTVEFLADLIDELGLFRPVLIGNSLGGLAAWRLAADRPDLVSGLILVAPGGYPINGVSDEPVDVPLAMKVFNLWTPKAAMSAVATAIAADPETLSAARLELMHDMLRRRGNGEAANARLAVFTLPDPTADLAKVAAPTLLIWGRADSQIPVDHADRFLRALPTAELIVFEDLGHVPHEEDPHRTLRAARAFLYAHAAPHQEGEP